MKKQEAQVNLIRRATFLSSAGLTASNALSLAPALIKCALNDQIVVRSEIWQPHKAMEAQAIEQLTFHLFVGEIEQLLDQQNADHYLGGERRTATAFATRARHRFVNCHSQRGEIDRPLSTCSE